MSEAWVSTARVIIWLTSRITGASLARSFSRSASSSSVLAAGGVLGGGVGGGLRVEPVERGLEFDRHGDLTADRAAGGGGDGGGREGVERIGHGEDQRVAVERDRQGPGVAQEAGGEAIGEQRLVGRVAVARR